MVTMLTKPNCPQCNALKMFLKHALNNKYDKDIQVLDQEADKDVFQPLIEKFQIVSLPAMIVGEDVLRSCEPSKTMAFLEKHVGKK
jgi:glutaredoxin-like protein NrdH